jgi:predicted nucleic acid-binding protein
MDEAGWLMDTSILVDLLRGHTGARAWIDSLPPHARFISVVGVAELIAGCRKRSEQRAVERELRLYTIVWLDESTSQAALELYRQYHLSHGVGFLDCLIAATAVTRGLRIATLNMRHFVPLPGVDANCPY